MRVRKYLPFILVFGIAVLSAVGVLHWMSSRQEARNARNERLAWVDEHQGLGQRTGPDRTLLLTAEPSSLTVRSGEPVELTLRLLNRGPKRVLLNGWLEPYPAYLGGNQFPLKVVVSRNGVPLVPKSDNVIRPLHTREDFFTLSPGESRSVTVELAGQKRGLWDLSSPGQYQVRLWYETYLTGQYVGVKAWTGETYPAIVTVTVLAPEAAAG